MRAAPAFAGSFYPERAEVLSEWIAQWSVGSRPVPGSPRAVLVPHAGWMYSGATAVAAFERVAHAEPATIVLLALAHRRPLDGVALLDVEGFESPLGPVDVDRDLAATWGAGIPRIPNFAEHSLEVQIPFVRHYWPRARVLPLLWGTPDPEEARRFGQRLAQLPSNCLLVATTDLSHMHEQREARRLDDRFRELLQAGDPARMVDALLEGRTEACGVGPVLTWMEFARAIGGRIEIVAQTDSGAVSGDTESVVGYLSAILVSDGDGA